jgi:hypothetical protein
MLSGRSLTVLRVLSPGVALVAAVACSAGDGGDSIPATGPTQQDFKSVAETLDYACGNLVCHGSSARNLRLVGDQGRRLRDADVPCGAPTTQAELEADYRSLVGLEPEVLSEVVAAHGAHPERLTLVRKARGTEKHKGGTVFRDSTDLGRCLDGCASDRECTSECYGDRCLVSWLAGMVDVAACANALPETRCDR